MGKGAGEDVDLEELREQVRGFGRCGCQDKLTLHPDAVQLYLGYEDGYFPP